MVRYIQPDRVGVRFLEEILENGKKKKWIIIVMEDEEETYGIAISEENFEVLEIITKTFKNFIEKGHPDPENKIFPKQGQERKEKIHYIR